MLRRVRKTFLSVPGEVERKFIGGGRVMFKGMKVIGPRRCLGRERIVASPLASSGFLSIDSQEMGPK